MKIFIILYFVIGIIASIVYTYLNYVIEYKSPQYDIELYFDMQFSVPMTLFMIFGWPIALVIALFTIVIPGLYMSATILLDKIFGGKKND